MDNGSGKTKYQEPIRIQDNREYGRSRQFTRIELSVSNMMMIDPANKVKMKQNKKLKSRKFFEVSCVNGLKFFLEHYQKF